MYPINNRWLGFELNILRRLKFTSIAIPFCGSANLDWYLKFWDKEVYSNDLSPSAAMISRAYVENGGETLRDEEIEQLLEGIYVPRNELGNPALNRYWSEVDAIWFDNLRERIDQLESPYARALAISHGLQVGEYARSFTPRTVGLRQPLSDIFRRSCRQQRRIINNGRLNQTTSLDGLDFIQGLQADALFVRFPGPGGLASWSQRADEWREVWVGRDASAWDQLVKTRHGRLGDRVLSKERYLDLITQFLGHARSIPSWAISHTEDGFLATGELAARLGRLRRIETIYHKDFSEFVGGRNTYLLVAR